MTDNKPYPDLHQIIRDAGGIVHSDGNIFFKSAVDFCAAADRAMRAAEPKGRPCKVGGPCVPSATSECACRELPADSAVAQAAPAAVAGLSAPVSPMAKMALALREKSAAERNDFDRRVQSGEWGAMPEPSTEADALPNHVAEVKGDDAIRILRWSNRVGAFDYPVGTKLYATPTQPAAPPAVSQGTMNGVKTVHELHSEIKAQAECAFAQGHGFGVDYASPSDRAWIEGYAHALATQPQEAAQAGALTRADADQLEKVITDFDECGETDVPDAALQRFAAMGYLKCVHYNVLPSAQEAIDAARAQQEGK